MKPLANDPQRLWDIVRFYRSDALCENLITDDEYAELAKDHAAVARLEEYDRQLRGICSLCAAGKQPFYGYHFIKDEQAQPCCKKPSASGRHTVVPRCEFCEAHDEPFNGYHYTLTQQPSDLHSHRCTFAPGSSQAYKARAQTRRKSRHR